MTVPPLLRYPIKKLDSDDFIKIDIYEYQPGSLPTEASFSTTPGGIRGAIKQTIILPMTESIPQNTLSTVWGEDRLGPLQAGAFAVATEALESPGAGIAEFQQQIQKVGDALNTSLGSKVASSALAQSILKSIGVQNAGSILSRTGGIVFNENVELLFQGVTLRGPFGFVFTMTPRSQKESQTIKNIILSLKKAMTPNRGTVAGAGAGLLLKAPDVFKISYKSANKDHPFMNRFKVCALKDLSVDYTPDGVYMTYKDSTPVNITLSLTFQELTPIYREDYDNGEGLIGTGY
jgi:hypothetical protein